MLDDGVGETVSVAFEVTVVHLINTNEPIGEEGVFLMSGLEEVEIVVQSGRVEVILQDDNVRIVEDLVGVLSLEGMEGARVRGALRISWGDGGEERESWGHQSWGELEVRSGTPAPANPRCGITGATSSPSQPPPHHVPTSAHLLPTTLPLFSPGGSHLHH